MNKIQCILQYSCCDKCRVLQMPCPSDKTTKDKMILSNITVKFLCVQITSWICNCKYNWMFSIVRYKLCNGYACPFCTTCIYYPVIFSPDSLCPSKHFILDMPIGSFPGWVVLAILLTTQIYKHGDYEPHYSFSWCTVSSASATQVSPGTIRIHHLKTFDSELQIINVALI